jgi:hypothetical protein
MMTDELVPSPQVDPRELLKAVKMLAAAFPRAAWRDESEAMYAMALAGCGVTAATARAAIKDLVLEEEQLPSIAKVLQRCRTVQSGTLDEVACSSCGSHLWVADAGLAVCCDCDHEWRL